MISTSNVTLRVGKKALFEDVNIKFTEGNCYGLIGFARVLTDGVTTFYLMDLVIEEAYRGQGFGTIMMNQIMKENGHLYGMLHTQTAKAFYERYGFREIGNIKKTEEIYREKPCG